MFSLNKYRKKFQEMNDANSQPDIRRYNESWHQIKWAVSIAHVRILIASHIAPLDIVHKSLIHYAVSTRCRIVAGKVPITKIIGAGFMQRLDGLIDHIYRNSETGRGDQCCDLLCNFFVCKRLIYLLDYVDGMQLIVSVKLFTAIIKVFQQTFHAALFQ